MFSEGIVKGQWQWVDVFKDIHKDIRDVDLQRCVICIVDFELIKYIGLKLLFFCLKI